jgi:2-polyprenyl-6-methoxyphenol hydroxylase-like FAD-dependent oxidoreductase
VQAIKPGKEPSVVVEMNGKVDEISGRLIVGADGRVSLTRKWGGFTVQRDDPNFILAGVWLQGLGVADDTCLLQMNPQNGRAAYLFPQGNGCARAYAAYPASAKYRIQGSFEDFIREFTSAGAPESIFQGAKASGPIASFDCADTYAPHPYKNGVALIGDAAASTDPSWGQGLSLTLRDVRVLRDCLYSTDDWDKAANGYAAEHDRYYEVIHTVHSWLREIMMQPGPAADAIRLKALPLIAGDVTRVPDHGFSGPDLPFNAEVKARFYGEI